MDKQLTDRNGPNNAALTLLWDDFDRLEDCSFEY
jgi:hypothetical protein